MLQQPRPDGKGHGMVVEMINAQEMLFVVDEHNQPLDPLPRSQVHRDKLWHRTTGAWVIDAAGRILCQKRSLKKDIGPGMWETFFGGHMGPGEDYFACTVQELGEELGIVVDEAALIPYRVMRSDKTSHKEFQHVFAYRMPSPAPERFELEADEIDEVRWLDAAAVRRLLVTEPDAGWVHKPWDAEVLDWLEGLVR